MPDDLTLNAKPIFLEAVELPEERRAAFVASRVGEDAQLRERVERLLRAHAESGTFMQEPTHREAGAAGGAAADAVVDRARGAGSEAPDLGRVGPYVLLRRLGEGSFGEVFLAEQLEPVRRTVALKVLKAGMDSRQVLARFEAERQLLASFDHPNIARLLDAGTSADGRPYFAMQLVRGAAISEYADANRLSVRDRVALIVGACRGVAHAHEQGVVHRDLKPGNLLVEVHDDAPVARVIDFGIARALSGNELGSGTLRGQMLGTPAYMSPEQAAGGADVDARSDVWSLGAVLYELLTGATPVPRDELRGASLGEIQRLICGREIAPPSERVSSLGDGARTIARRRGVESARLAPLMRGELDWAVMRALDRERTRRYAHAGALADDLQRWLDGRPVEARPRGGRGPIGVARRFARRHRRTLAPASILFIVIAAGALAWNQGWLTSMLAADGAAGEQANVVLGPFSTVVGGTENTADGLAAVVGGRGNTVIARAGTIPGGESNRVLGARAVVSGGNENTASDMHTTISGGRRNRVGLDDPDETRADGSTIGGGILNVADWRQATVGGGFNNNAISSFATIGGGEGNTAGASDRFAGAFATVAGGHGNVASGTAAAIPGGRGNEARGVGSFAAGSGARATRDGSFVWSDMGEAEDPRAESPGPNSFTARARGGFTLASGLSTASLLKPGEGAWGQALGSRLQRDLRAVGAASVLEGVKRLEVRHFEWAEQTEPATHLGPTAEQFHELFGLGRPDGQVSSTDLDGVALVAIQALLARVEAQDARIAELERRLGER